MVFFYFYYLFIYVGNGVLVLLVEEIYSFVFFRSLLINGYCNLDFNFKIIWVRVVWYFYVVGIIMNKVKKIV